MGHLLTTAIERLSSISFEDTEDSSLESFHGLIKEYLRSVIQLLNEMDASIDQYPLFSIAKILGKSHR
ncbi:hypothetical protein [Paenibacillus xylanilyticus]|uniref:hypothetical protein n=1 Tax=Paenibacillus xylanilyticus TaxID=248903 RepID=UPI0039A22BB0